MKTKFRTLLSIAMRGLAVASVLLAVVVFAELPMPSSVTSAYPSGPTATPHFVQYSYFVQLPAIMSGFPAPASPSYYVTNMQYTPDSNNPMYDLGFELGQQDLLSQGTQDHLVILDFGYPVYTNTTTVGTYLPFEFPKVFHPTSDIRQAVTQFAKGYFVGTGADLASHLRIVVGTNSCCVGVSQSVFEGHGTGWADMMTLLIASISSSYATQVDVVAGSDIELSFSDAFKATQWVKKFAAETITTPCNQGTTGRDNGCLYNYGTAGVSADSLPCATAVGNSWHGCDVWNVSWGITKVGTSVPFARPLPEIYHTADSQAPNGTDANSWSALSAYSVGASWNTSHYASMYFVGSLTQFAQCGALCGPAGQQYANNPPGDGYILLYDAVNSQSSTSQTIRWSTDIGTQLQ